MSSMEVSVRTRSSVPLSRVLSSRFTGSPIFSTSDWTRGPIPRRSDSTLNLISASDCSEAGAVAIRVTTRLITSGCFPSRHNTANVTSRRSNALHASTSRCSHW
jgi:hypothetical protein